MHQRFNSSGFQWCHNRGEILYRVCLMRTSRTNYAVTEIQKGLKKKKNVGFISWRCKKEEPHLENYAKYISLSLNDRMTHAPWCWFFIFFPKKVTLTVARTCHTGIIYLCTMTNQSAVKSSSVLPLSHELVRLHFTTPPQLKTTSTARASESLLGNREQQKTQKLNKGATVIRMVYKPFISFKAS